MTKTTNGFEIAEMDLQLRGPGEFFGTRQHGLPEFKMADVTQELEMLHQAREDALALLADDPKLAAPAPPGAAHRPGPTVRRHGATRPSRVVFMAIAAGMPALPNATTDVPPCSMLRNVT